MAWKKKYFCYNVKYLIDNIKNMSDKDKNKIAEEDMENLENEEHLEEM